MGDRGPDPEANKTAILATIRNHWAPVIGTSDLADEIGVARQTMDRKLRKLKSEEYVNTDKVGQSRVWWITDKGRKYLAKN